VFAARARRVFLEADAAQRVLRYASGSVLLGFAATLALDQRPSA
jgi:threonine/homoserine/homoserine lactone efflux protein